ncbi:MAG: FkbM family methyltransferase [Bacteroidia bacterium]|nr:FkbM family methyltransferase [Bacteroidia bacterium]
MKTFIKYILQKILGLKTYLYVFARFIILKIRWDKKEKDFFHFMKLISGDGIILDLGANIGVTSYHLAKKFPGSMVYAFEPLALNMNTLRRIKSKFGLTNIHEFQVAVGEQNGTIEMVMPVVNHVPMHGLSHVVGFEKNGNDSGLKSAVQMIYLDEFDVLLNSGKRVTAIKIDIENFEYYALKGAQKIIAAHRPVIYCELWDNEYRGKCIGLLNNLGYSAFVLQGKELVRVENAAVEKHNFFFLPNSLTD